MRSVLENIKKEGMLRDVMTPKMVCDCLMISEGTLRKYRNNGEIGYSSFGDKVWFTKANVEDFLNAHSYPRVY